MQKKKIKQRRSYILQYCNNFLILILYININISISIVILILVLY